MKTTANWKAINCDSPQRLRGKEPAYNEWDAGDSGSVPGSGRSSAGGNGNPFQYSCLGNSMDRGTWQATVQRSWRVEHNWAVKSFWNHKEEKKCILQFANYHLKYWVDQKVRLGFSIPSYGKTWTFWPTQFFRIYTFPQNWTLTSLSLLRKLSVIRKRLQIYFNIKTFWTSTVFPERNESSIFMNLSITWHQKEGKKHNSFLPHLTLCLSQISNNNNNTIKEEIRLTYAKLPFCKSKCFNIGIFM